jgi:putative RNA 2'-phosphotransferase
VASRYLPKTLAKTINYIAYHAPGEYGLFWDLDGTMPWKELYWALQEDPSLRFVRESHIKELSYLGLDLPFHLDEKLLRLKDKTPLPHYPLVEPPEKLFYACGRKRHLVISRHGLRCSPNRSFIPLLADEDLALRTGLRRDPEPVMIQIDTKKACLGGILFREAGNVLYLAESVPPDCLILPLIREEELERVNSRKRKEEKTLKPKIPLSPGSFDLDIQRFQEIPSDKTHKDKKKKKGKKGPSWKQEVRKERRKREF